MRIDNGNNEGFGIIEASRSVMYNADESGNSVNMINIHSKLDDTSNFDFVSNYFESNKGNDLHVLEDDGTEKAVISNWDVKSIFESYREQQCGISVALEGEFKSI